MADHRSWRESPTPAPESEREGEREREREQDLPRLDSRLLASGYQCQWGQHLSEGFRGGSFFASS